jgi:hypothetical protein
MLRKTLALPPCKGGAILVQPINYKQLITNGRFCNQISIHGAKSSDGPAGGAEAIKQGRGIDEPPPTSGRAGRPIPAIEGRQGHATLGLLSPDGCSDWRE